MATCPKCHKVFKVMEDELPDACPYCRYRPNICSECGSAPAHLVEDEYSSIYLCDKCHKQFLPNNYYEEG